MKTAIVTTTINVPEFMDGYCRDSAAHGRKDLCFVIVADKKTPPEAQAYCENLEKLHGFRMEYFSVDRQREYLERFPELDQYLPWNSVQRRNIGMLYAYELGCDTIVTVDDDNYLLEPNLLEEHLRVGTEHKLKSYSSSTGWMNPCQFLKVTPPFSPYHRGFPLSKRFVETTISEGARAGRVVVNVGMWLGDPDVDAWIRMSLPLEATEWTARENFALGLGTWAPFNSQQTAVARDVVPAYFLNPNAGRYDDIWGSFILHCIANHMGDLISYGSPIVSHLQKRSLASLWRDIDDERMGTLLTDNFVTFLRNTQLGTSTYRGCYEEIANSILEWVDRGSFPPAQQAFLLEYVRGMQVWLATLARVPTTSATAAQLV
jgi:glycosyltransferase involved in cell wall biosynthesis